MIHINTIKFIGLSQYKDYFKVSNVLTTETRTDVWLDEIPKDEITCIYCKRVIPSSIKGHTEVTITHSFLKHQKVQLHVKKNRYRCYHCNRSFSYPSPLTFKDFKTISSFTLVSILNDFKYTDHSFSEIGCNHFVSESTVRRIFKERVSFARGVPTSYICIDEKCYLHGNTKFCLPILDFETNKLIDVCHDRKKRTLIDWLRQTRNDYVTKESQNGIVTIKMFCIDMNQNYYDAIRLIYPNVPIAIDSFHVIKNINDALNKIRIKVMKRFYRHEYEIDSKTGEIRSEEEIEIRQPDEYRMLKIHWKLLLKTDEYIPSPSSKTKYNKILGKQMNMNNILDYLLSIDKEFTLAWMLKERYVYFNSHATIETANEQLSILIDDFIESGIPQFISLANMLSHWKNEIVNSFTKVNGRRISNGPMEGMNAKIEKIITNSNGITDFNTLRNRVLLRYGIHNSYHLNPRNK